MNTFTVFLTVSRKEADRVYDLPGLTFDAKFGQYSGYLNGVKGNYIKYWCVGLSG